MDVAVTNRVRKLDGKKTNNKQKFGETWTFHLFDGIEERGGESLSGSKTECLEIPSKTAHRGLQLKLRNYTLNITTTAEHFTLYTVHFSLETQTVIEVD